MLQNYLGLEKYFLGWGLQPTALFFFFFVKITISENSLLIPQISENSLLIIIW